MSEIGSAARSTSSQKWLIRGGVAALLVLHFALTNAAHWNKSATFDENSHIGDGLSFWATGDFRMGPESVLSQRWMSLPLYLGNYKLPPTDNDMWYKADVWGYNRQLLYELGNDGRSMVRMARAMNSLWSVALAWVTFFWARSLFGTAGGFVALMLYVFSPLVLANAALATNDIATAFAFTASTLALWRLLHCVTPGRLAISALLVGCAFVTKFSAVLLIVIGLGMAVIRIIRAEPIPLRFPRCQYDVGNRFVRFGLISGLVVLHVFVAAVVVWAVFNFRYDKFTHFVAGRDVPFTGSFDEVLENMQAPRAPSTERRNATMAAIFEFCRRHHVLPEAFLYANANAVSTTSARSSFLNGRYGIYGFPSFFPYCFFYKTPIAAFLLLALALAAHVLRRFRQVKVERRGVWRLLWEGFYLTSPLWLLLAVYWGVSIMGAINIGARHLLPTFPATFILGGVAGAWLYEILYGPKESIAVARDRIRMRAFTNGFRKIMQLSVVGGLVWLVGAVLFAFPNYLAYFNQAAGGPAQGYRHLVDSSLDWGQELPALHDWLSKNIYSQSNQPRVYISYMGTTPPSAYQVHGSWLPCFFPIQSLEPGKQITNEVMLTPGVYCIGATMLQCVYNTPYAGPWRADYEQHYRLLFELMKAYLQNQNKPEVLAGLLAQAKVPNWQFVMQMYESARFGRLCAFLRHREPDAMINYSILVYRVSNEDIQKALLGPPAEEYPAPAQPGDNVPY